MNSQDFCFWLQGYFELRRDGTSGLTEKQVNVVLDHLNLVFKHEIDPAKEKETTATASQLNEAHGKHTTMRC